MDEQRSFESSPDLWEYWRIILEGRWYIILAFVAVVASTAVFTFTADPVYETSGRILVLTNRADALGLEELNLPSSLSGNIRNEVPNWIEMMMSRSALEKATGELTSDEEFVAIVRARESQDQGSLFDAIFSLGGASPRASDAQAEETGTGLLTVDELRDRITVQSVRNTDIIEVRATGGSPREAQMIVNALLDAYLELDKEITHSTLQSVNDYLDKQLQQTRDRLESLEEEFQRLKKESELAEDSLLYQRYERNINITQELYTLLSKEQERVQIASVGQLGSIRVVGRAEAPKNPISPKKKLNLLLGALVGLTLGTGFAFLREYLDKSFKTPKQLERALGIPSLGAVFERKLPRRLASKTRARQLESMLITHLDTKDPFINAHIAIEASLRFTAVDRTLQTIMVTSAVRSEGKSALVVNLGMVLSLTGRSTVIVCSDLRKPVLYRIFGAAREPGLANVVLGELSLDDVLVRPYAGWEGKAPGRGMAQILLNSGKISQDDLEYALRRERQEGWQRGLGEILIEQGKLTPADLEEAWEARQHGLENLHLLPPGAQPPNPTDFLGSERMQAVIEELKQRFEVVLFDTAPLLSVPDASVLSAHVDGTIMVVKAEATNHEMVQQVLEQLRRAGANLIGAVLTQVSPSTTRHYGSYYGYYYGYEPYGEALEE